MIWCPKARNMEKVGRIMVRSYRTFTAEEHVQRCPLPIIEIMMDSVLASSVDYSLEDGQGRWMPVVGASIRRLRGFTQSLFNGLLWLLYKAPLYTLVSTLVSHVSTHLGMPWRLVMSTWHGWACRTLWAGHPPGQAASFWGGSWRAPGGMESGYCLHLSIAVRNGSEWLPWVRSEDLCDLAWHGSMMLDFYRCAGLSSNFVTAKTCRSTMSLKDLQRTSWTAPWANGAQKFYFIATFWAPPAEHWTQKRRISFWCQSTARANLPRTGSENLWDIFVAWFQRLYQWHEADWGWDVVWVICRRIWRMMKPLRKWFGTPYCNTYFLNSGFIVGSRWTTFSFLQMVSLRASGIPMTWSEAKPFSWWSSPLADCAFQIPPTFADCFSESSSPSRAMVGNTGRLCR